MKAVDILKLAHHLMANNNSGISLFDRGWIFGFNKRKNAIGVCNYRTKTIEFSIHYIYLSESEIKDTILHEMAHAFAPIGVGHSYQWQMWAIKLGAKPERTAKINDETVDYLCKVSKYSAVCPGCNKNFPSNRKRKKSCSCSSCSNGRYNPAFKLNYVQNY